MCRLFMLVNSVSHFNGSIHKINAKTQPQNVATASVPASNNYNSNVSFSGLFSDLFVKKFPTDAENKMYKELNSVLKGKDKANFDILYKTGRLSNRSSNDNSSTLENLHKIYTNKRIEGLDTRKILSETIERIANPFSINQKFGVIPEQVGNNVLVDPKVTYPHLNPNDY